MAEREAETRQAEREAAEARRAVEDARRAVEEARAMRDAEVQCALYVDSVLFSHLSVLFLLLF